MPALYRTKVTYIEFTIAPDFYKRQKRIEKEGIGMKTYRCRACDQDITDKNTIGLNKKLIGRQVKSFLCMDCIANYLNLTVEELKEKIEEFKDEGCTLFS